MLNWLLRKIIGTKNQRQIKKILPVVTQINQIAQGLQEATEDQLRAKTAEWQERFKAFHPPQFLAGVWLRIADEQQVDDCLRALEVKFQQLAKHFPELDQNLVAWPGTGRPFSRPGQDWKRFLRTARENWR